MSQQQAICDTRHCGKEVESDMCETCREEEKTEAFNDGKTEGYNEGYETARKEFEVVPKENKS